MKKLSYLFLLLLLLSAVNATYDFDLEPEKNYRIGIEGSLRLVVADTIHVRNGLLDYKIKDDMGQTFSMTGEYLPKDKILKGHADYRMLWPSHPGEEEQSFNIKCDFYSTELTAETKEGVIIFKNCIEYWGGMDEEKKEQRSLTFYVQNSNIEKTKIEETKLEDSGARFSDISGQVEILFPTGYEDDGTPIFEDEENWQFAKLDMALPYGAMIKLQRKSGIILSFPDLTTYEMRTSDDFNSPDETTILLPIKQQKESTLKLLAGSLYNNIKRVITTGDLGVEGSQAVAGIKGTTFILEENGTHSKLKVIEGVVNFAPKNGGEPRDIVAGEEVVATSTGLSEIKTFDVATEKSHWNWSTSTDNQALSICGIPIMIFAVAVGLIVMLKRE